MAKSKRKPKIIPPPQLPPDVPEEEIDFSDEDVKFVKENIDSALFVAQIDTGAINRQCGGKPLTLEDKYEEEKSKKKAHQEEKESTEIQVDPVDVLPVKTLKGELHYRTVPKKSKLAKVDDIDEPEVDAPEEENILNKSQRREKAKKSKREAKKQEKELPKETTVEEEETPQAAVLAEVKEEVSAEETLENKKNKLAELGVQLLSQPEANIKSLKEMLDFCKDGNIKLVKLGLLSLLAVFKDIIPGYRIRLPTEKELEMKVSKEVKKTRFYESTLLKAYKSYLQKLVALEKQSVYNQVATRCLCTLLDAVPHFNFRDNLLIAVVSNISSPDEVVRRLCCSTVRSLFINEAKHGGELTVQAVRLIAAQVKSENCQLHPNSIEVFMSIRFDEDIGKRDNEDENKKKYKKNSKKSNHEQKQAQENERKKSKQEMMSKIRDEVNADYKGVTYEPDAMERRKMQTETLSAVFETYFRILRHTMYSIGESAEADTSMNPGAFGAHPLLAPCLDGLAKFTQQLDLDYIGDLMKYLKKLASSNSVVANNLKQKNSKLLTVSERLRCCLVAFKVMRSNLNALNVDLHDFFIQLYNLVLEYRPGRDSGEVLAESLKIMLCDDRHQDMQKAAAFVKRLATFALCFGCAESMSALVTLKILLQRNVKCRNLLENDAGGGSVSGSIAKYQPYATDPNLSGALATVLWELNLLTKHYHPAISTMATTISSMNTSQNQTFLSAVSPVQAFADFSLEKESFVPKNESRKLNNKRKRESTEDANNVAEIDIVEVSKKLKENFTIIKGIKEEEEGVRKQVKKKKQNSVVKKILKNPKSKKKV